jgi:phage-related protein
MIEKPVRKIFFYKKYYLDFYNTLDSNVRLKFNWTLKLIATVERLPVKFFRHIENTSGLYEIRVEYGGNIYRVFSFFDQNRLVILINGFQKKSQKTPKNEIEKAERLKKEYFDEKRPK